MKKIIKENKGFSLVEVIVVLAIMSVAIGFVSITASVVNDSKASSAAKNMKASMTTARVQSMAKGTQKGELTIKVSSNGSVYATVGTGEEEKICSGKISVYATKADDLPTSLSGSALSGTTSIKFNNIGIPTEYTNNCFFFKNGKKTMVVFIYPDTGKIVSKML